MSPPPLHSQAGPSGSLEWAVPGRPRIATHTRTWPRRRPLATRAWRALRDVTFAEVVSAGMVIVSLVAYLTQLTP